MKNKHLLIAFYLCVTVSSWIFIYQETGVYTASFSSGLMLFYLIDALSIEIKIKKDEE